MIEHYDILTIYDFYDDLLKEINNLLNYCIKNYEDAKLIEDLTSIYITYKRIVMKNMNDYIN